MKIKLLAVGCVLAAAVPSAAKHLSEFDIVADSVEIRRAVAGRTCSSSAGSTLSFGRSTPEVPGAFERVGRAPGTYQLRYGTLLVDRGGELHSHVVSVSLDRSQLYLGGERFRCEPAGLDSADR